MLTIPAAHFAALGFDASDSPVQTANGTAITHDLWADALLNLPEIRLSVEHSMPTLLRALTRQYGTKLEPGEVPQWYSDRDGGWWMISGNSEEQGFVPPGHNDEGGGFAVVVPALAERLPRLEALAAAIALAVS